MTRPTRLIRAVPRPSAGGLEYDNTDSGLDATTIQEAIDELMSLLGDAAVLPLTGVVDGEPVLIWDDEDSLIPVEV